MIDHKWNIRFGQIELIAVIAAFITAAAVMGMNLHAEINRKGFFHGDSGGGGQSAAVTIVQSDEKKTQTPEEESTDGATAGATTGSTALTVERASEEEPGSMEESLPAAATRVVGDGEFINDILSPGDGQMYSEKELILVNPWHLLPEDYEADLEHVEYGHRVDECAAEALRDMLEDCREEGYSPLICSSYRDRSKQERLFENDVRKFMYRGMSEEEAREETARNVALPGSSEHEAGLAVDIVYTGHQALDETQEDNETQQWLMEHCSEYGFILRYPRDKQDITGITYEPWHYRYVGTEAAEQIMSRGICLEEYLGIIDAEQNDNAE